MNRFRKLLVMIFLLTPWWMSSVAFAQQVEERYVINFEGDRLPADLEDRIQMAGGVLAWTFQEVGIAVAVSTDPNFTSAITASADVTSAGRLPLYSSSVSNETVQENAGAGELLCEDDSDNSEDVCLTEGYLWGIHRVHASDVWGPKRDKYVGSHDTVVAVIDTGIAWNHPDLKPNFDLNNDGIDNDDNKKCYRFVDNKVDSSCAPYPAAEGCRPPLCDTDPPPNPTPPVCKQQSVPCVAYNHGTHVAGIIAAASGGGKFVGVGPNLGLASYKVSQVVQGHLVAYPESVWAAMRDAANQGYEVINFSWGWCYVIGGGDPNNIADCIQQIPDTLKGSNDVTAFNHAARKVASYANKKGAVIVAAAGNFSFDLNGTNGVVPADLPQVIGVSATAIRHSPKKLDPGVLPLYPPPEKEKVSAYDELAWYSNFGASGITVTAPGGDCGKDECDPSSDDPAEIPYRIASTAVVLASCWNQSNSCCKNAACSPAFLALGGTSMATPHVAGVIGLVRDANPNLTPNQVRTLIKATADDLGDHQSFGHGMVNAYEAVLKAVR